MSVMRQVNWVVIYIDPTQTVPVGFKKLCIVIHDTLWEALSHLIGGLLETTLSGILGHSPVEDITS